MKPIIIFDYDGVIVDSIEIFARTVRVAACKLNQPTGFDPDDLKSIQRMTIEGICDYVEISRDRIPEFLEVLDRELYQAAGEIPLFPNMAQVIRQLSRAGILAIVSATPAPIVNKVLKNHSIKRYFDCVIGGDSPGAKSVKIKSIIEQYDSEPEIACMVGDTISDIEEGNAADVATIAVSWGWHSIDHLLSARPDSVANRPEDLIDLTQQLIKRSRFDVAR